MTRFFLDALDAAHGDALAVHVSGNGQPWLAIIDGGPPKSYAARLKPYLTGLGAGPAHPLTIDLLEISHLDEDHIGGVLNLLEDLVDLDTANAPAPYDIRQLWLNSFAKVVDDTDGTSSLSTLLKPAGPSTAGLHDALTASVTQANRIHGDAKKLGIHHRELIKAGDDPHLADGAPSITILNPTRAELDELQELWRKTRSSGDTASFVEALAYDDPSVPNLSSIVTLVEADGKSMLLTGDARGDRILEGLDAAGRFDGHGRIHVDILKIPHHGSINNVEPDFFEKVTADHYVISTDGIKFPSHPGAQTLEMLTDARGSDDYVIHLTNPVKKAITTLDKLKRGRTFEVRCRPDDANYIRVEPA